MVVHATSTQPTSIATLPQAGSALLVIFGASGDLTRRKLIPALYDLTCVGCVPRKFEVLGVGRTPMTTEEFQAHMRHGALDSGGIRELNQEQWANFEKRLFTWLAIPATQASTVISARNSKKCTKPVQVQTICFTCRRPPLWQHRSLRA